MYVFYSFMLTRPYANIGRTLMTESEAREIVCKYEALLLAAQRAAGAYEYGPSQAHLSVTDDGIRLLECDVASYGEPGLEVTGQILSADFLSAL